MKAFPSNVREVKEAVSLPAEEGAAKKRVVLLVDGQNIYFSAKDLNASFNYRLFLEDLSNEAEIVHKKFFSTLPFQMNIETARFLEKLHDLGFDICLRKPKVFSNKVKVVDCPYCLGKFELKEPKIDGDMDIYIAVEAFKHALSKEVEEIIILSGDLHFLSLVDFLPSLGVEVRLMGFIHNTSTEVRENPAFRAIPSKYLTPKPAPNHISAKKQRRENDSGQLVITSCINKNGGDE